MTKRTIGERIFIILLMIALLIFFIGSLSFMPGLRTMPLVFSALGLALLATLAVDRFAPSVRELLRVRHGGDTSRDRQDAPADELSESPADVGRVIAYMVGFLATVFVLGMAITIPVYIALFLKLEAKARWHHAIFAGIVMIVIVIAGMRLMGLHLWPGIIPTVIPRYVGGAQMPLL